MIKQKNNLSEFSTSYYENSNIYKIFSEAEDKENFIFQFLTPYLKNKTILDLGCGNGRHLQLINSISKFSIGLDQSLEQLKQSNIKTNMIVGNGVQLPFQNESFDCITSFWVWGTILDENKRLQVLNESKRVLKRNGSIFLIENDISSEFEYLRGRHLNNKTQEYNHWLIQHGFSILNKMETLITFDNLLIAQDVFQKIWQDRLFQLPQSQIVQHKVIIFELKVN